MSKQPTRADVAQALKFYQHLMNLDNWTIDLDFQVTEGSTYALINASYEYMRAELHVNLELIREQNHTNLNRVIVHELAHCALAPLCDIVHHLPLTDESRKTLLAQQELVVTLIEKWPIWQRVGPRKKG